MSPRARSKKPPVATRRKRLLHAIYLAQPFLQFFALMAVLFVLGRCSPLSPSTDKSVLKTSSAGALSTHNPQGDSNADEEDIKRELKDVSSLDELPLISQSDFATRVLPNAILAEKGSDLAGVQNLFRLRARQSGPQHGVRVLVLRLLADQKEAFFRNGTLRVNLVTAFGDHMAPDVRRAYFSEIHKLLPRSGDLSAKAYLVMSDDDMAAPDAVNSIPVPSRIQMAISPDDQKAWIQLNRGDSPALDDQQQKLIESAKDKSISMALVLE